MEKHMEETAVKRRRRLPEWLETVITVVVCFAVFIGGLGLLLGRDGIALVEGWLLARYIFVDEEADVSEATDQALSGLVSGLGDRWSYYLDEESYQQTVTRRANNYVGVGITVTYEREEGLLVQAVTAGGPAEAAGVVPGDIVTAVDGVSIAGEARYDATPLIQGEEGTAVELTLLGADGTERTVTCVRATLRNPSAARTMLEGNVGYVKLSNFYSGSADSFREEVDALISEGAVALVIDVRDNPGGYTSELKEMLDYLLPEGPVFTEKSRWGRAKVYESDASCIDLPMVVLVNRDTYSAAELLAAQIRESIGAPIVGEVTSGKGYYQITYMLPNGGGIGLSSGTYCTGNGHSLIGEGIIPDVELELSETEDNQLQAAVNLLKK